MSGFLGEFECKLDSKLRIALPAALRKQLPIEAEGRFVVNRGFEQHLVLYPFTEWRRVTAQLDRLNPFVKKHRDFARYFHRGATELELDTGGRLLLPRRLLDYAGIRDAVILLAYAQRIECWDPTLYDNILSDEPADFAQLAEEIMGDGGHLERSADRFRDFRDLPALPPGSRH
ncbi:MAG: division/cell wall cluster transcriptional repressor MraZ [Candidatus Competibacter denitrificans]|jgi:MraZ protein|uniref:Transcriptional regulator MraZ n=1 Tax=Candidatus Competibacter denitrificans Run_A_D11 TaxID=1400863 RepID=W6M2Q4_9GAMM|nr:division/cell wall cluster transcriptional repressor MraZ [Candidatus Competibacter denitrificans]CDI01806.1 Protein MraZ 1 [Candidatus Competibacter denitrificans Run_A_D11]HAS86917.1 division/cell wall cluster transcriptional repressor MraZ [Candidatus Competibacteraceae bacterium]HRC68034.1 division/cell wall cluster transcriptional repressor MraZ [Candidatus Competibacter denitrificans]